MITTLGRTVDPSPPTHLDVVGDELGLVAPV